MKIVIRLFPGRAYFVVVFTALVAAIFGYGYYTAGSVEAFMGLFARTGFIGFVFFGILIVFLPILLFFGPFWMARAYIDGYVIQYDAHQAWISGGKAFAFSEVVAVKNMSFPVVDYKVELRDGRQMLLKTYLTDFESTEVKQFIEIIKSYCRPDERYSYGE